VSNDYHDFIAVHLLNAYNLWSKTASGRSTGEPALHAVGNSDPGLCHSTPDAFCRDG